MKILIVSATPFEIAPLRSWLEANFKEESIVRFSKEKLSIDLLISGVGLPITAFSLGTVLARQKYDLAIQAGIAGAFDQALKLGEVVEIVADRFADLGAEDKDSSFLDLQSLGLQERESGIFNKSGQILNDGALGNHSGLKKVSGLSVNKASGSEKTINELKRIYPEASVESMEGAAFLYACRVNKVAMLAIRAISNYVTPRNRDEWQVELALNNLNETLIALLNAFELSSETNRA